MIGENSEMENQEVAIFILPAVSGGAGAALFPVRAAPGPEDLRSGALAVPAASV